MKKMYVSGHLPEGEGERAHIAFKGLSIDVDTDDDVIATRVASRVAKKFGLTHLRIRDHSWSPVRKVDITAAPTQEEIDRRAEELEARRQKKIAAAKAFLKQEGEL